MKYKFIGETEVLLLGVGVVKPGEIVECEHIDNLMFQEVATEKEEPKDEKKEKRAKTI